MNNQDLQDLKKKIRDAGLSGAEIARLLGKSSSRINACLKGHYPFMYAGDSGRATLPDYLEDFLWGRRLLD